MTLIDSARLSRDQVKTRLELRLKTEIRKKTITCGLIKKRDYILETRNYALVAEYTPVKESKLKLKTGNKTCTNSRIVGV